MLQGKLPQFMVGTIFGSRETSISTSLYDLT